MKKEWNAVEVLQHSRHDWLNKLQLIKGNLSLNRFDRVNEIIEEITINAKNEAKLTNLKAWKLAGLLLTFNWEHHHFFIEYEVLGDGVDLLAQDDVLASWCLAFFKTLNEAVKPFAENNLSIGIQASQQEVRFFFDLSGIIEDEGKIEYFLSSQSPKEYPAIKILEYEIHNDEMIVTLEMK